MGINGAFRSWITPSLALVLMTACTGDDGASNETEDGSSGTAGSTSAVSGIPPTTVTPGDDDDDGPADTTTGGPATTGDTTGEAPTDTGSADTTTGEATGTEDTTGVDACAEPPPLSLLLLSADAEVTKPMELVESMVLPDNESFARSFVEDEGTITFEFEVECDYEVIVHGLVWDRFDGFGMPSNPDSYFVVIDDDDKGELLWPYGCQTVDQGDALWAWLPIVPIADKACGEAPLVLSLEAGTHTIELRNREGGGGDNFAGVTGLAITDDAEFDPLTLFDPYPE